MYTNDPSISIADHLANVAIIENAGGTIPEQWRNIKANYDRFSTVAPTGIDNLTEAIASDATLTDADLARLTFEARIAAMVRNDSTIDGVLNTAVAAHTGAALRNAYAPAGADNYTHAAARFDKAAQAFTEAWAKSGEPNVDPLELVSQPKTVQETWIKLPLLAHELTTELHTLTCAARLAGLDLGSGTDDLLGLVVETKGVSSYLLRQDWEGGDERTGRWGALLTRHVTIRAAALTTWEPMQDGPRTVIKFDSVPAMNRK